MHGAASSDPGFTGRGYRWAQNLKPYPAPEPQRFVVYFDSMAGPAR